jgi:probable DNA metabolism protein
MKSACFIYDGSFEGFLTAVFDVYNHKSKNAEIWREELYQPALFGEKIESVTSAEKAERVWKGMMRKIGKPAVDQIFKAFLSEIETVETTLLRYIEYGFESRRFIHKDFSHPAVMEVAKTVKQIGREKHRMDAFVRFRKTKDGIYFAAIKPDFNVLPLNISHFKARYADQKWIIYDLTRNYGVFYDLKEVRQITMDLPDDILKTKPEHFGEEEVEFQELWKSYFEHTNIKFRKNSKLHQQYMPKRYWDFLTENHSL